MNKNILDAKKLGLKTVKQETEAIRPDVQKRDQTHIGKGFANGFSADPRGVNASFYREYGRNQLVDHFKGNFLPTDIQDHPFDYDHNYNFELQMKTVQPPSNMNDCECTKITIDRNNMIEGWRLSLQNGWKKYKYPVSKLNVDHVEPKSKQTLDLGEEINKETLVDVADKAKYGKQKDISLDIPAMHPDYVPGKRNLTTLKMGNMDMENNIIAPKRGRRGGFPRTVGGHYAGKQAAWQKGK